MQHGRALVRISIDRIPQKSDYILISVGAHIHPQNPVLHIGGHLNFSIEGRLWQTCTLEFICCILLQVLTCFIDQFVLFVKGFRIYFFFFSLWIIVPYMDPFE